MLGIAAIKEWVGRRRAETEHRQTVHALEAAALRNATKIIQESISELDNYVDPRDAWNDDGKHWIPMGSNPVFDYEYRPPFEDEAQLGRIRSFCRYMAAENEFAAGELETRVSYIVGTGHVYDVETKDEDDELTDADRMAVMEVIDEFVKANYWHRRQQEIQRRLDRDGECFLRFFVVDEPLETPVNGEAEAPRKVIRVRFVEPAQIKQPESKRNDPDSTFGIETEPDDVESVRGYWVDGERVDAKEIQHRKRNVDCNVKRGLPLLYQSKHSLPQVPKITRNAAVVTAIQAAFALIRKHASASQSAVSDFVAGKRDAFLQQKVPAGTTKTRNYQQFPAGTILDVPSTTEYEFPASGVDPSKPAGVVQMVLRGVGSRACIPEFMISGDASNANYASTLVAEGPAVKMFEREQWTLIAEDMEVFDRVLALAVEQGRISKELVARVKVTAEPPNVISRDELKGAQKDKILVDGGILSPQTWSLEHGLDYEREQANIEEHVDRTGGSMLRPLTPQDMPMEDEDMKFGATEHLGPGDHPSGTPQGVHGHGGASQDNEEKKNSMYATIKAKIESILGDSIGSARSEASYWWLASPSEIGGVQLRLATHPPIRDRSSSDVYITIGDWSQSSHFGSDSPRYMGRLFSVPLTASDEQIDEVVVKAIKKLRDLNGPSKAGDG